MQSERQSALKVNTGNPSRSRETGHWGPVSLSDSGLLLSGVGLPGGQGLLWDAGVLPGLPVPGYRFSSQERQTACQRAVTSDLHAPWWCGVEEPRILWSRSETTS